MSVFIGTLLVMLLDFWRLSKSVDELIWLQCNSFLFLFLRIAGGLVNFDTAEDVIGIRQPGLLNFLMDLPSKRHSLECKEVNLGVILACIDVP